jgi:hypothetical protein
MDGDRYRQRDRHTEMQKYSETHTQTQMHRCTHNHTEIQKRTGTAGECMDV